MNTGKDKKSNVCVAVIDDNAQLRDMSVKQLEKSGYTVLFQTGNGQEALQKLKEHDGWPDVCIIEEDFATAKVLLKKHPDLKVLISSTEDDTERVRDVLKAGVSGYVLKFSDPEELVTAIRALSENKKYFSVGISGIVTEYFKNQS